MHVGGAIGDTIRAEEIIVSIAVKGAAEALRVTVVSTRSPDGQAHSPVTNIGPNKGPGGKYQLQEKSHTQ